MHLEVLVEGQSDRTALENIFAKIFGRYGIRHTWAIHKHQGSGKFPPDPNARPDPHNPTLLHNLPASLRAYGKALKDEQAVVVVVDLDDRDCITFKEELVDLLKHCDPQPNCLFRIAIEELEAWFLGDKAAILAAYPTAREAVLSTYVQDSIVGTWEVLAQALYPGGPGALKSTGRFAAVQETRKWARDIAPMMAVDENDSPSFRTFRDGLRALTGR